MVLEIMPKNVKIDRGFLAFCHSIFQHKKKNLYSAIMDSRRDLAVKDKEKLREALGYVKGDILKEKVFMFEIGELVSIYEEMLKLKICQK